MPRMRQRPLRGQRWHIVDERTSDRDRTPAECPDCGNRQLTVREVFGGSGFVVETPSDVEFCRRVHGSEVDVGDVLCWSGSTVTCSICGWELETAAFLHRAREEEARRRQFLALEEARLWLKPSSQKTAIRRRSLRSPRCVLKETPHFEGGSLRATYLGLTDFQTAHRHSPGRSCNYRLLLIVQCNSQPGTD
jgi:hypothetical protein